MARKSRKRKKVKLDINEDFNDFEDFENFDEEFDSDEFIHDTQNTDWDEYYYERDSRKGGRRRSERREDMKKLYSQLEEWEEYEHRMRWN